jgi:hypothetical protein
LFVIWELDPNAKTACNIGQLSHRIGDELLALEWLTICLRLQPKPRTKEERDRDEARRVDLAVAKRRVGILAVFTNRPNATVFIAGRQAKPGDPVFVKPGQVTVWAQDGTRVERSEIEVMPGDERSMLLTFSDPPALPTHRPQLPTLVRPQLPTLSTLRTIPPSAPKAYPAVVVAGGTLAAIGIVTGAGTHISARNTDENAGFALDRAGGESVCLRNKGLPDCREWVDGLADSREYTRIEIASFGLAGALAVGTVIYAVCARKSIPTVIPATGVVRW